MERYHEVKLNEAKDASTGKEDIGFKNKLIPITEMLDVPLPISDSP